MGAISCIILEILLLKHELEQLETDYVDSCHSALLTALRKRFFANEDDLLDEAA